MLNNAVKRGWLARNPLAGEKLGAAIAKDKRIFSPFEIGRMEQEATTVWAAIIRLDYTSGLRKQELRRRRGGLQETL